MKTTELQKEDKRLARGRRWFEYHCYESEDSSDAIAWHHTHQKIIILRKLEDSEVIGSGEKIRMYRVRFPDNIEWDVFDDELVSSPSNFENTNTLSQEEMR